uniref:Thioredoxin domain-containing protein n=1 Tax=viral metagenome TaxID=1070528 RepID=A0A6C0LG02_9ZZZZ
MVSEAITKVDNENLEKLKDKIRANGAVILYHWNSCGHCNRLMPVWADLINRFADRQFYQIELNYMQQAPHEFGRINSFPHITAYRDGEKINYNGSRDLESLSTFVKSNLKPLPPPPSKSSKTSKSSKSSKSSKTSKLSKKKSSVKR